MRKLAITLAASAAFIAAPALLGYGDAKAVSAGDIAKGIIGGVIAGAVINSIVRSGQYHCHGRDCHRHGYARAGHYHDAYGNIIYYQAAPPPPPVYAPPPPAYGGGYPPAHYDWCAGKYRSYDARSNTFQPYGNVPRRPCISPYM